MINRPECSHHGYSNGKCHKDSPGANCHSRPALSRTKLTAPAMRIPASRAPRTAVNIVVGNSAALAVITSNQASQSNRIPVVNAENTNKWRWNHAKIAVTAMNTTSRQSKPTHINDQFCTMCVGGSVKAK